VPRLEDGDAGGDPASGVAGMDVELEWRSASSGSLTRSAVKALLLLLLISKSRIWWPLGSSSQILVAVEWVYPEAGIFRVGKWRFNPHPVEILFKYLTRQQC
jgi:hypothetical protein